jgi:large subunit ribosomal protein L19e
VRWERVSVKIQKRLAAQIFKTGVNRVWVEPDELDRVASAITRDEVRKLIHEGAIKKRPETGISRGRVKKKRLRKGPGSREGSWVNRKRKWIIGIRRIRGRLSELRDKKLVTPQVYRKLFLMAKGGSFRSISHLNEYIETHRLARRR